MAFVLLAASRVFRTASASILFLLLGVFGLLVLRYGLRGVRRGRTPHCAKCGYNLTANRSGRCPECGTDLQATGAIARGARAVAYPRVVIGAACLLAGVVGVPLNVRSLYHSVRWYDLKPTAWVFHDAESSVLRTQDDALCELCNRFESGRLSADQMQRLGELLLSLQGQTSPLWRPSPNRQPSPRSFVPYELTTLGQLYDKGRLTAEQGARFLQQAQTVWLEVRPTVIAGNVVPARLRYEGRTGIPFFTWGVIDAVRCDGLPEAVETQKWGPATVQFGVPAQEFVIWADTPGRHTLECDVNITVQRFVEGRHAFEDLPGVISKTLRAEFEILPQEPAEYVKLVRSGELDRAIGASLRLDDFSATYREGGLAMQGWIKMHPLTGPPIGVAFDAVALVGDQTVRLGRIVAAKGDFWQPLYCEGAVPNIRAERVEIRLVPNAAAAMETVDIFEIYGGEVWLGTVAVEDHPPRPAGLAPDRTVPTADSRPAATAPATSDLQPATAPRK